MISFIVPSFNQGEYIKYTLDSIVENMASDDELIIQDGLSTDNTSDVVEPYLADSRIRWFSEKDRGFSEAVSRALARASQPIVGIMSSDDAYLPGFRQPALDAFSDPDVVLVYGDYEHIDESNRKLGDWKHRSGDLTDILSLRVLLPQSSLFFRRSALEGLNILDLAYDYVADVVLFNQIAMRGKVKFIPKMWSQVRIQPGCRTGKRNPGEQYLASLDSVFSGISPYQRRKARAAALMLRARYEASSMHRLKAVQSLLKAVSLDPTLVGHWIFPRAVRYIALGPDLIKSITQRRNASRIERH